MVLHAHVFIYFYFALHAILADRPPQIFASLCRCRYVQRLVAHLTTVELVLESLESHAVF